MFNLERNQFLSLCQKCSVLPEKSCGIKINVPDELKVVDDGVVYYPVSYVLSFINGNPTHTAILHDLKSNSITSADLGKVAKYEP